MAAVQTVEYATIRWDGNHSWVVRPGGQVEIVGTRFEQFARPDGVDPRAFYMNIAMNYLAKEGYEYAGTISGNDIVMKHAVAK